MPPPEIPGFVANEAYCMALAGEIGLRVAPAEPLRANRLEALLVERYDRNRHGSEVRRIHQEDFCQATGRPPEMKYESEGGPGIAECGSLIRVHGAGPGASLLQFLDALLFNLLIGNADAHSKNYSLLLEGPGAPRLAPRGRHLDRIGDDLGIAGRRVRTHANEVAERALDCREAARERLLPPWRDDPIITAIDEIVAEFADVLRRAADEPA